MTIVVSDLSDASSSSAVAFRHLQIIYLIGYGLAAAGNHIQDPYRYGILASYHFNRSTIEALYLCAHISTLFLGTLVSSLADKLGRRLACILAAVFYAAYCFSMNFDLLSILIVGSIFRGVAHSLYNTNFEAWLIQAHHNNGFTADSLKRLLRNASVMSAVVAIVTSIVAQVSAELFGYIAPFDIAIGIYILLLIFLLWKWTENYGDRQAKSTQSFVSALHILRDDPRIILLGLISALAEATIYVYSIEWTPALQQATLWTMRDPLPLGLIFACFTIFNFVGSLTFKPLCNRFRAQSFLIVVLLLAAVALTIPVIASDVQPLVLFGFCLFQFCIGIYLPSASLLRSQYLPDAVRSTLMNYFRVPRFLFMFTIIIWHFSVRFIFLLCVTMLIVAALCMVMLRRMKMAGEEVHASESVALLFPPPPFDMKVAKPQMGEEAADDGDHRETAIEMENK